MSSVAVPEAGPSSKGGNQWLRRIVLLIVFLSVARFFPPFWCGRGAADWWNGDAKTQAALANGVESWLDKQLETATYATGDPTFDGEWLFGTYQMAILGLVQAAEEHPQLRADALRRIERAEELLLSKTVRHFDQQEWKEDAIADLTQKECYRGRGEGLPGQPP